MGWCRKTWCTRSLQQGGCIPQDAMDKELECWPQWPESKCSRLDGTRDTAGRQVRAYGTANQAVKGFATKIAMMSQYGQLPARTTWHKARE